MNLGLSTIRMRLPGRMHADAYELDLEACNRRGMELLAHGAMRHLAGRS